MGLIHHHNWKRKQFRKCTDGFGNQETEVLEACECGKLRVKVLKGHWDLSDKPDTN